MVPAIQNDVTDCEPLHLFGVSSNRIDIADHVCLGTVLRILDGVTAVRNAVFAADGAVTKSVANNESASGVPARFMSLDGAEIHRGNVANPQ